MYDTHPRTRRARLALLLLALAALAAANAADATPLLISEVFYDASGADDGQSFVEISGTPGTILDGLVVEGINGSGGGVTDALTLAGAVGPDGLFVLGDMDAGGLSMVAGADQLLDFDFQNGPDSVVLRDGALVLDAVGYGVFGAGDVFAGEGAPAADAPAGSSVARFFADVDTDDNATDFEIAPPSPGQAIFLPEPTTRTLMLAALGTIGWCGRRRCGGEVLRR